MKVLTAVDSHLSCAINVMKALSGNREIQDMNYQRLEPSNKNIVPQCPFFSTKRKHEHPTIRLAKPTQAEKQQIRDAIQGDDYSFFDRAPLDDT